MYYFTNQRGHTLSINGNVLCADSDDMAAAMLANILHAMCYPDEPNFHNYSDEHEELFPRLVLSDLTPKQVAIYNSLPCY
jgi:hypothetical protein